MLTQIRQEIKRYEDAIEELEKMSAEKGINVSDDIRTIKGTIHGLEIALDICKRNIDAMKIYLK